MKATGPIGLALIAASAPAAHAQAVAARDTHLAGAGEAQQGSSAPDQSTEIVVTGSRISREGFIAPTPVTTLGAPEIERRLPSTLGDTLAMLPGFRATSIPTNSGVFSRGGGLVSADLRGLGATRTLVLVDDRRFVPSGADGVVDLKLVPSLLIQQVEAVTGGASAAWGSDAIAGVVNFRLKRRIDQTTARLLYGTSQRGDTEEFRASLATGGALLDRLSWIFGIDAYDNRGVDSQYTRGWGRREVGLLTNADFATNGLPHYIISPNVRPSNQSPGGLITGGPLRGIAFGSDGQPYPFHYGTLFGTSMIGGDNGGNNLSNSTQLQAPIRAFTTLGRAELELSASTRIFAELSGGYSRSGGYSQQPRDPGTLTIAVDNAYLPASIRDLMAARGLATIPVGRTNNDSGPIRIRGVNRTARLVIGADGTLGPDWSWSAYGQYGRNRYTVRVGPNNRIQANFFRAIDAVVDPATGAIRCRSSLSDPGNGCRPQNIFGDGSVVVDDYSFGTSRFNLVTTQKVAALSLSGSLPGLPAGPVSVTAGAEYRTESARGTSDPLSQRVNANGSVGAFVIGNQLPLVGDYEVWEAFAELSIPLLADKPLAREANLNGALRRTHYSTSGSVVTWKAGADWKPVEALRLRATVSRDIRAPNLAELFQSGGSVFANIFDPAIGSSIQIREVQQGNPNLKPERARTWTAGLVYNPPQSALALTLDYFSIDVRDVIGTIPSSAIARGCFAGVTAFCPAITFNPDGTVSFITVQTLNSNRLKTSGLDAELRYRLPAGRLLAGADGTVSLRLLGTYIDELVFVDASGTIDRVGQLSSNNKVGGVPHFSANADVAYENSRWTLGLQARLVGKGRFSAYLREGRGAENTVNENDVPAFLYLNLSAQLNLGRRKGRDLKIFFVINNLLDTDPPLIPSGTIGGANETSTNPAFYDVIGRTFKLGLQASF